MLRLPTIAFLFLLCCACEVRKSSSRILLFTGRGTSSGDVAAVEAILSRNNLDFSTVSSFQLNRMRVADLAGNRLLIVPGGNFVQMGKGLSHEASANVRLAVQNGLNYLGICAGAFLAGNSPFNGFNLTSGARFGFYSAEDRGIRKTAVPIAAPGKMSLDVYWEDGPQLSGWGDVVAKYPDGTPAVTESKVGQGWVILSGVHPEAAATWRRGLDFHTPIEADHAYAGELIRAALNRTSLPHY